MVSPNGRPCPAWSSSLLTLYLIGYRGPYRDLRRQTESVVEPVPWEAAT